MKISLPVNLGIVFAKKQNSKWENGIVVRARTIKPGNRDFSASETSNINPDTFQNKA